MKKAVPAVYRPSPIQVLQENFLNKSRLKPDGDSAIISLQLRWNQRKPRASSFAEHFVQDTPPWAVPREALPKIPAPHWAGRTSPEDPSRVSRGVVVPVTALGDRCHHSNFHQALTMHPNELQAKLTYCMSPVRNDSSEVIFCTNM